MISSQDFFVGIPSSVVTLSVQPFRDKISPVLPVEVVRGGTKFRDEISSGVE